MKQRRRGIGTTRAFLFSVLFSLAATDVFAIASNRWEFTNSLDYAYDFNLIEVAESEARLLLQAQRLNDASFSNYMDGVLSSDLRLGSDVSMRLVGVPGFYSPE